MRSKILTLPISRGAGDVSTINRFKEDMETLLEHAENLFPDGLLKDNNRNPDISINAEAWGRYGKILDGFLVAVDTGWNIPCIRYAEAPSMISNFSSITIILPKSCTFTEDARTALTMAALLSDRISTTTEKGKTQIIFTVNNIWMIGGM